MFLPFFSSREKARVDACLDGFLSFLLIEWETHGLFEKGMARAAEQTSSPLREQVEGILFRVEERGMSMDESIELFSRTWDSSLCQRTSGVLRHAYAHGCTPPVLDAVKQLAEDVRQYHRLQWKTYAQKMVLYSLVFIGVSALVPALFLAFVTIGSRFLEMSLTSHDVLLFAWIGFPLIDAMVLGIVHIQAPPLPRVENVSPTHERFSVYAFGKKFQQNMDEIFRANGNAAGWAGVIYSSALESAGLFIIVWSFFVQQPIWDAFWVSLVGGAILAPFVANFLWQIIVFESHTRQMEQQAADSLLILSSIPATISFVSQLEWVARIAPHPISSSWKKMVAAIRGGKNPVSAFAILGSGRKSPILASVRALLIRIYESGHPFRVSARTLAQEIITHHASIHERRAVLLVEKYTILLAGGLLVPLLLGVLAGVVSGLPLAGMGDVVTVSDDLFQTTLLAMRGYLLMYALVAGLFVGIQEGKPAEGWGYCVLLLPCAQLSYTLGNGWVSS